MIFKLHSVFLVCCVLYCAGTSGGKPLFAQATPISSEGLVEVDRAEFGKTIGRSDQLSDLGSRFQPNETVILKVSLNSRPESGQLSCRFYFGSQEIVTISADLAELAAKDLPANLNAYGVFHLKPTSPFPPGNQYRAEVFYNDQELGTYPFEVVKPADKSQMRQLKEPGVEKKSSKTPSTPTASAMSPGDIVNVLLSGTAYVEGSDEDGNSWSGTAWLLDKQQRLLITNDHVANATLHSDAYGPVKQLTIAFPEYRNGKLIHDKRYYEQVAKPIEVEVIYGDYDRDLRDLAGNASRLPSGLKPVTTWPSVVGIARDSRSIRSARHPGWQ